MKIIIENWRRYIKEFQDPIENPETAPRLSQAIGSANDGMLFFKAWNSTAGEVLFKIPGTSGAEGYTFGELGLDLALTFTAIGLSAKAGKGVEKLLMKLYRKQYSSNRKLYKFHLNSAAEAAIILRAKAPAKIKSINTIAAITPEVFLETLAEPAIKDMLLKTKQKGEVVEVPQEIASRLNMKMN